MCGGLQSGPQFLTSHELDETFSSNFTLRTSRLRGIAYHHCCPSLTYSHSLQRLRPTCVGASIELALALLGQRRH